MILLVALKEKHKLDSVLIIPANVSPHKQNTRPTSSKHRLNMLKKAFSDLSYCQVLPLELRREGPSYTIDTIEELEAKTNQPSPKNAVSSAKAGEQIVKQGHPHQDSNQYPQKSFSLPEDMESEDAIDLIAKADFIFDEEEDM